MEWIDLPHIRHKGCCSKFTSRDKKICFESEGYWFEVC